MFENLTKRLSNTFSGLRGRQLTEDNIRDAVNAVRVALLEADVGLPVVMKFLDDVREKAVGSDFVKAVRPGDAFVKIVHDSLVELMGSANEDLQLSTNNPPAVVLVAGLQGSGKTTTVAKLAHFLRESHGKRVAVVSADVYRPAAAEQLATLGESVGARVINFDGNVKPVSIATKSVRNARKNGDDVLLVDTAGRLAVDEDMMVEITNLHKRLKPAETLFVVDAMTGQDAVRTAEAFNSRLALTGIVLAKTDGDARGGAALSVRAVTQKPIKFLGVGEAVDALEQFHPDRIASRILGMGDVLSLIETAQRKVDEKQVRKNARKILSGSRFTMEDMREQLEQMLKMGSLDELSKLVPNAQSMNMKMKVPDEAELQRHIVVINSMTIREREFPNLINASRKKRIASGSGSPVQVVNQTLRKYEKLQKQMRKVGRMGKRMKNVEQLLGDSNLGALN